MVHNALDCIYPTPGYNCMGEPTQADIDAAQRYLDNR